MSDTTTVTERPGISAGGALALYIFGAIGLIIILAVTFYFVRKRRFGRAKKYIKQQSQRSVGMGPKFDNTPKPNPWKYSEVKARIKARRKGLDPDGNRPVATISDEVDSGSRPQSASSLRPQSSRTYREDGTLAPLSLRQQRLQRRVEVKKEKRERKTRQKEVKHILKQMLEGQTLPGDQFPDRMPVNDSLSTQVGPLRRESLAGIPNESFVIERSHDSSRSVHKTTGSRHLQLPKSLYTWSEESHGSGSNLSGRSSRNVECEVTVHHISDDSDDEVEYVARNRATTEL